MSDSFEVSMEMGWRLCLSLVSAVAILIGVGATVQADAPPGGEAHPPFRVHGNARTSPTGYSPTQIRHAYGFDQQSATGADQVIGIVDAFDDPNIAANLGTFITTFRLPTLHGLSSSDPCTIGAGPHPCFQKVFAQGKPRTDSGWALEISLDAEWSHAVAPKAEVLLVEAQSNSFANLLGAVDVAVGNGSKVVSMSWGGSEFLSETSSDSHFSVANVTFTASSGDNGTGVIYPSSSPYVVAVGGTTLPLDSAGNLTTAETAWSGSGGGISAYEVEPAYQSSYPIPSTGGKRGVPDVAYDADPSTGLSVYDTTRYQGQSGWFQIGGTSAGAPQCAPQWAALVALVDQSRTIPLSSSNPSGSPIYKAAAGTLYGSNYRDITSGSNGSCGNVCTAATGYDFVTGLGTLRANNLVPYLSTH